MEQKSSLKGEAHKMVKFETSLGDFVVELNSEKAPISVENFLKYVKDGHYEGTIFHRVIKGFMIQGGGFDVEMHQKAVGAPIKNESSNGLKNDAITIAMARTSDPDSATAQFFINLVDNDYLNGSAEKPGYAVFGKVVLGQDVIQKIGEVKTGSKSSYQDVPVEPVVIKKVELQ